MNMQTEITGEEVKANIKQLFDIVETIEEIVNALEDHELVAMQHELFSSSRAASRPNACFNHEIVSRIVGREMHDRWEKERDRLTQSSPFYRFFHDEDRYPY